MNLRFLEAAVWLAHFRNFRVTAEHLHLTQAAVSSRILTLESELGVALFERQAREVVLTAAGVEFIARAKDILERYRQLKDAVAPLPHGQHRAALRVGAVPSMAYAVLPYMAKLLEEGSTPRRIEVITDSTTALERLRKENRLDIVLTVDPQTSEEEGWIRLPLCRLGMYWTAAPSVVSRANQCRHLADIAHLPLIAHARGRFNAAWMRSQLQLHADVVAPIVHVSNALSTMVHMAIHGMGVAVLPPVVIQNELREGLLHVLPILPMLPMLAYVVMHRFPGDSASAPEAGRMAQRAAQLMCERYSEALATCPPPADWSVPQ